MADTLDGNSLADDLELLHDLKLLHSETWANACAVGMAFMVSLVSLVFVHWALGVAFFVVFIAMTCLFIASGSRLAGVIYRKHRKHSGDTVVGGEDAL